MCEQLVRVIRPSVAEPVGAAMQVRLGVGCWGFYRGELGSGRGAKGCMCGL